MAHGTSRTLVPSPESAIQYNAMQASVSVVEVISDVLLWRDKRQKMRPSRERVFWNFWNFLNAEAAQRLSKY